jgi:hypothetical protein
MHSAATASDLLKQLTNVGAVPTVDGFALTWLAQQPPAELVPAVKALHTGVRAILTGRTWYGCSCSTWETAAAVVLSPALPLPAGITLLCVEGDQKWDRVRPAARLPLPDDPADLAYADDKRAGIEEYGGG